MKCLVTTLVVLITLPGVAAACDILEPQDCGVSTTETLCDPLVSNANDDCAGSFQGRGVANTYSIPRPADMGEWGLEDVEHDGSYIVCSQAKACEFEPTIPLGFLGICVPGSGSWETYESVAGYGWGSSCYVGM